MARRNRGGTAVAVAGALVVLAGCSGGGEPGEPDEPTSSVGPLGAYFEKVGGSFDEEQAAEQARRSEEIVAACMAEQGFEYTPMDTSRGLAVASPAAADDMPAWDSIEYAQQYGYGATTWQDMPGATSEPVAEETWTDPNQEYVDAMSDSEREAYYAALYGEPMTGADTGGAGEPVEYDWTTAGCQGKAQHEVYEVGQPWADEAIQALEEDFKTFYEGINDDPRIADIDAEWADCMADAGYSFDSPSDAQQSIYDQLSGLYEESGGLTESGGSAVGSSKIAPPAPDEEGMAELRELEIATATADRQCQIDVKYTQRQQEISFDLEQQFVDEHKAELDAWVAKYADQD